MIYGEGTAYVIDQLGTALRQANMRIGELAAENAELREKVTQLSQADRREQSDVDDAHSR